MYELFQLRSSDPCSRLGVYEGTLLFPAILRGSIEIVKLLLSVGADTNIPGRIVSGKTDWTLY